MDMHTPRRRRKQAPYSPSKRSTKAQKQLSEESVRVSTSQTCSNTSLTRERDRRLRDPLDDLSLWNDQIGEFRNPTPEKRQQILSRLRVLFNGVVAFTHIFPWILIEFEAETTFPDTTAAPFYIAGLIAVMIREGEPFPVGVGHFGIRGEGSPWKLPEHITRELRPYHKPKKVIFQYLHHMFPTAQYISTYAQQILIELQSSSDDKFVKSLPALPRRLGTLMTCFHNGEILNRSHDRYKEPNPSTIDEYGDHELDDTDYLMPRNGGYLRPGCLLECKGECINGTQRDPAYSNSGILVKRNDETRITVASHTWDSATEKSVYHLNTKVGVITSTIGEDIGLVQPLVPWRNDFHSYPVSAQRLLPTAEVEYGDIVSIDSCLTGNQLFQCTGARTGKRYVSQLSGDHTFVVVEQGIFSTNTPIIPHPPQIRGGMCGTPLLRVEKNREDSSSAGEVCGFFSWADIKGYNGPSLHSYCQSVDPLIDAGWVI